MSGDVYEMVDQLEASDGRAERIVAAIFHDVRGRKGWGHEFDGFDPDVQVSIVNTWLERVREVLAVETATPAENRLVELLNANDRLMGAIDMIVVAIPERMSEAHERLVAERSLWRRALNNFTRPRR